MLYLNHFAIFLFSTQYLLKFYLIQLEQVSLAAYFRYFTDIFSFDPENNTLFSGPKKTITKITD